MRGKLLRSKVPTKGRQQLPQAPWCVQAVLWRWLSGILPPSPSPHGILSTPLPLVLQLLGRDLCVPGGHLSVFYHLSRRIPIELHLFPVGEHNQMWHYSINDWQRLVINLAELTIVIKILSIVVWTPTTPSIIPTWPSVSHSFGKTFVQKYCLSGGRINYHTNHCRYDLRQELYLLQISWLSSSDLKSRHSTLNSQLSTL